VYNLVLVYLSISTCFGWLWAHHQERQLCFCNTWYLLFCILVCRSICSCIPDSHTYRRNDCVFVTLVTCYSVFWYAGAYAPAYRTVIHTGETTVFLWHLVLAILYSGMQEHTLLHTRQSSIENNKYQVLQKHSCFSWWWAHSRPKHVEIDKYTKNKSCTKLVLFTRFGRKCVCFTGRVVLSRHHSKAAILKPSVPT